MANLHLEIIRFFLKKKNKQNKANEITKERILPRNMPDSFVCNWLQSWIVYWDDGETGFLAIRLIFYLRVFFCSNLKFEMLLWKAPYLYGDVKTQ